MADMELVEQLAKLEHDQWVFWTTGLITWMKAESANEEKYPFFGHREALAKSADILQAKWEPKWVPYDKLDEDMKEIDREFARKTVEVFELRLKERLGI